ncbi:hypothetical protein C451_14840 [Halococcus thailandensis JCM 13552]|uniref:Uncharacterized protein n=1 Tax=Halococcus thailandensis JCM 13552 TaxID=1227457 RepID=M0N145_9EURY|nr:hypothetical protein C451_14840 [Halococcus thailandensis JCM 13552]
MTDETITDITDATSRTLYECGTGALRTRITTSTNSTNDTITTVRSETIHRVGHEIATRGAPGFSSYVSIDRGAVAE